MIHDLLGAPAPGFDAPLDVLEACHGRIARQCDTLETLLRHLPGHGADSQAQGAARAVLAYFDTAAVHHHDDEERNLFPLLEAANAPGACDLVETLTREHDAQALLWRRLRVELLAIADGMSAVLDAGRAQHFVEINRAHVQFENAHLLPLARSVLGHAELERLGRAMAARRGVPFDRA